jgi:hypothetical protein
VPREERPSGQEGTTERPSRATVLNQACAISTRASVETSTPVGGASRCAAKGSKTVKVDPSPRPWFVAVMMPPCLSTSVVILGRNVPRAMTTGASQPDTSPRPRQLRSVSLAELTLGHDAPLTVQANDAVSDGEEPLRMYRDDGSASIRSTLYLAGLNARLAVHSKRRNIIQVPSPATHRAAHESS